MLRLSKRRLKFKVNVDSDEVSVMYSVVSHVGLMWLIIWVFDL